MAIRIHRLVEDDWQTLRNMRLAALQDSPSAFGSTYAREAAYDEADWRKWAARSEERTSNLMLLAFDGDECVGIGGVYDKEGRAARVVSMWVAPAARGQGVGKQLLTELIAWGRSIGRDLVELHVTVGNTAAERLYRSTGFQPTDDFEPLPSDPTYRLNRMELRLDKQG